MIDDEGFDLVLVNRCVEPNNLPYRLGQLTFAK